MPKKTAEPKRPPGRPRLYAEPLVSVDVGLPQEAIDEVDEWREEFGLKSRAAAARDMIEHAARWRRGALSKRRVR